MPGPGAVLSRQQGGCYMPVNVPLREFVGVLRQAGLVIFTGLFSEIEGIANP